MYAADRLVKQVDDVDILSTVSKLTIRTDYLNVDQMIYLIENCLRNATYRPHSGHVGELIDQ